MSTVKPKIPSHWVWASFDDVASVAADLVDPKASPQAFHVAPNHIESWTGRLLPFTTVADDGVMSPKHRFRRGQILYSKIRPYLAKAALATVDGLCSADMYPINTSLDDRFLLTWMLTPWFTNEAVGFQGRSLLPKINQRDLAKVSVPIAPLAEQRRIVAKIEKHFTRLDAGVEALKRVQANLKRYRASVLKAACEGRLVPTEAELAKAEGRGYEPAAKLIERLLERRRALWNLTHGRRKYQEPLSVDAMKDRSLPDGWAWATVDQLAFAVQYGSSSKTSESTGGVPVLRMGNILDGRLSLAELKYLPSNHYEFPELLLETGDILFNRTNSPELVGKVAVYRGTPTPCSYASYLIRVRLMELSPDFVSYYLNSTFGRAWVAAVVTQQVGQANVNGSKLRALAIPVPPVSEQRRIVDEVERLLSGIEVLEGASEVTRLRARALRSGVLRDAFEGNLVPRHKSDEPAAALLERIKQKREQAPAFDRSSRRRPPKFLP